MEENSKATVKLSTGNSTKMQTAKEKLKDMASTVKEKVKISKVGAQEKKEKLTARNKQEKEIAIELAKAKKAQAKAEMHQEKAEHRAEAATTRQKVRQAGVHLHRPAGVKNTYPTAAAAHTSAAKHL